MQGRRALPSGGILGNHSKVIRKDHLPLDLCGKNAGATGFLDFLLGRGAEKFRLDNHWQFWQMSFAENFEETVFADVQNGRLSFNWGTLILGEEGRKLEKEEEEEDDN